MAASTEARKDSRLNQLLTGRSAIDFVGRSRLWLYVTIATLALCVGVLGIRGLNFGIEFTGGSAFLVSGATKPFTVEQIQNALGDLGLEGAIVQVVQNGEGAIVNTPAISEVKGLSEPDVTAKIAQITGVDQNAVAVSSVGPRWGEAITRQAARALIVFLLLVIAYISVRFEWRMAIAAVVCLLHDIFISVGVYGLVGFEVTPASVIAFLTILGYSLYDTVVVFDRVREDTAKLSSTSAVTYGETANRALNAVLVRSLSTSATAILPVGSLLFIGANLLGARTLSDLALALFIGLAVGTYSSVIVATPFLVWLKEKEPRYAELKQKVAARRCGAPGPKASGGKRPAAKPKSASSKKGTSGKRAPSKPGSRRR
ncbi:MAG: protein translocase subunit SecF [Egibacteraceae bacterium]